MFGRDWRFALAYELGVEVRVVERLASGVFEMPPAMAEELRELLAHRIEMTGKLATLYAARLAVLRELATDSGVAGNLAQAPTK
jgi:hypothetical protein